jgi:hypothetical protein
MLRLKGATLGFACSIVPFKAVSVAMATLAQETPLGLLALDSDVAKRLADITLRQANLGLVGFDFEYVVGKEDGIEDYQ